MTSYKQKFVISGVESGISMVQKFECYRYPNATYLVEIISTTAKRSALAEDIQLRSAPVACAPGDVKVLTSPGPTQDHEHALQAVSNNRKRAPPAEDVNRRVSRWKTILRKSHYWGLRAPFALGRVEKGDYRRKVPPGISQHLKLV